MVRLAYGSAEEEIRRLKNDLYMARHAVIGLMAPDVGQLLHGYYHCECREEGAKWFDDLVRALIERADSAALPASAWGERRSLCPLCNRGSDSPYVEGYALPEGLRRHLAGWGNTHRCVVMEIVSKLAYEHWHERFGAAERRAWQAEQDALTERRRTETVYRTSPVGEPKLVDEGAYSWSPARTPDQLAWAEERLKGLGVRCVVADNVRSWLDERDDCVVYADPRHAGRINFEVWRKPLPKKMGGQLRLSRRCGHFYLLDSWKKDLASKYIQRVTQQLDGMRKR
jgi:hypothetical protein